MAGPKPSVLPEVPPGVASFMVVGAHGTADVVSKTCAVMQGSLAGFTAFADSVDRSQFLQVSGPDGRPLPVTGACGRRHRASVLFPCGRRGGS